MIVQSACQSPSTRARLAGLFSRPKCPRCGTVLLVAEESRFNAGGRIDHDWSCDDCGNEFATTICLWSR